MALMLQTQKCLVRMLLTNKLAEGHTCTKPKDCIPLTLEKARPAAFSTLCVMLRVSFQYQVTSVNASVLGLHLDM